MKFQELLTEDPSISFDTAIKTIKSECKPFLSQADGQFMYMGASGVHNLNFLPHSKLSFSRRTTESFDFMFKLGMKMAFNVDSKDSFFCGDSLTAMSTGDVHFCFPKGKFSFVYSKKFRDASVEAQRLYKLIGNYLHIKGEDSEQIVNQMFEDILTGMSMEKFLTDEASGKWMQIFKMPARRVRHAMKRAFGELYVHNEKLDEALKAGCEIIVYQSEGVYTIPWQRVVGHMVGEGIDVRSRMKFGNVQVTRYLQKHL